MRGMDRPSDRDAARALVAANGLTAAASAHLTAEVAMKLPFEDLARFKDLLKRFFSTADWDDADDAALSRLVAGRIEPGAWWAHDLGAGLRMEHGMRDGRYTLWVTGGGGGARDSIFDRVFSGPVVPEATPHPRKVKFDIGGVPAPGRWYRRGDDIDDERVAALLEDPDVTDVMVAGDFVTVGLHRRAAWEDHLDRVLARVTAVFWEPSREGTGAPARTRDELVQEGLAGRADTADLHLLDPDLPRHRDRLEEAAASDDPRLRRVAVATLALSGQPSYAREILEIGVRDGSRIVRRAAVDAAADREDEALRPLFEGALGDEDEWVRWKAVRALRDLGIAPSRDRLRALAGDPDFRVRMEVAAALRG